MGDAIPPEVVEQLRKFNEALTALEDTYQTNFSNSLEENMERPPLEKVDIDLMSVFVINSLYWMLLCTHGRKPKENELLQNEIERTKDYMNRLKRVKERKSAPRLNQNAARSFVRNALWEPKQHQPGTSSNANEDEGQFEMEDEESSGESTSMEDDEVVTEEHMEEEAHVNVKNTYKRPAQGTNDTAGCVVSKKKRL